MINKIKDKYSDKSSSKTHKQSNSIDVYITIMFAILKIHNNLNDNKDLLFFAEEIHDVIAKPFFLRTLQRKITIMFFRFRQELIV